MDRGERIDDAPRQAGGASRPSRRSRLRGSDQTPGYRKILAGAVSSFGSFGFGKTTVEDIAARAHVSKPLFYRYFENKEHVFEVVVADALMEWNEVLADAVSRAEGCADALRILHETSVDYARTRPFVHRLFTRDTEWMLATHSDVIERGSAVLRRLIEQILQRGLAAGEVRSDLQIEDMADLVLEIHLAYTTRIVVGGAPPGPRLVAATIECMLSGMLAPQTGSTPGKSTRGAGN